MSAFVSPPKSLRMATEIQAPPVRRITFPSNSASTSPCTRMPNTWGNGGVGEFAGGRAPSRKLSRTANRARPVIALLRSEEHTSELQSHSDLVCRLLLEKKKKKNRNSTVKMTYM